jgi:hypothetical protein
VRSQAEFRLSCVVADHLARALPPRAAWSHFPAGEARSEITGARLKRMGLARGWPDYLIVLDGKLLGIELKAPGGKVGDVQREVGDKFVANGFAWTIARSLADVESFLIANDVPLRARIAA